MTLFAKLAIVAVTTVTVGGGGTALGVFSKLQNTSTVSSFNKVSLQQEASSDLSSEAQGNNHSGNILQGDEPVARTQVAEESSALSVPVDTEKLPPEPQQIKVAQNLRGEGNCVVEDGWEEKVISHLPKTSQYVSVFCENSGGSDASLTKWRGFLPKKLFVDNAELLVKGAKFDIQAKDDKTTQDLAEDDTDTRAVFSSQQFVDSSVTGKFGSNLVDETVDHEQPVYEVELMGSKTVDKFYLQWL